MLSQLLPSVPQDLSACWLHGADSPGREGRSLPSALLRKKPALVTPARQRAGRYGEASSEKSEHADYFCAG